MKYFFIVRSNDTFLTIFVLVKQKTKLIWTKAGLRRITVHHFYASTDPNFSVEKTSVTGL